MIKVYVAGKYSADNTIDVLKNIGRGRKVCADLFANGYAPFCPWHDADFIIMNPEYSLPLKLFYDYCIQWLLVSDVMLVISGAEDHTGVIKEIEIANKNGIKIFYSIKDLEQWRLEQFINEKNKEI